MELTPKIIKGIYFQLAGIICAIDLYIQLNATKNKELQKCIDSFQDEFLIPNIYFIYLIMLLLGWILLPYIIYLWINKKFKEIFK